MRFVPIVLTVFAFIAVPMHTPADAKGTYPRTVREIPPQYRGAWDEIVSDGCEGREARFQLERRDFFNFEVAYDVLKITVISPTLIVVHTRLDPQFGTPEDGSWKFRLVKNGTALSGPNGKSPYFGRCRFRLNRHTGSFERNRNG